jgi:hypothetical protein
MRMKSKVDVWVASKAAATLTPPGLSIVSGEATAITVRTCVLRRPLERRLEMSLTVDHATARQFSQACQRQTVWERKVVPSVLIAATVLAIVGVTGTVRHDSRLVLIAWPLMIVLLVAAWIGRLMLTLLSSTHHPRLKRRHTVLIRDVDRETAQAWVNLNSPEDICIVG